LIGHGGENPFVTSVFIARILISPIITGAGRRHIGGFANPLQDKFAISWLDICLLQQPTSSP
jgi:hypothetical protein